MRLSSFPSILQLPDDTIDTARCIEAFKILEVFWSRFLFENQERLGIEAECKPPSGGFLDHLFRILGVVQGEVEAMCNTSKENKTTCCLDMPVR